MEEKKSELDFSTPQRQSQSALILIIYNRFKNLFSRFWYFIVFALFTGERSSGGMDTLTLSIIALSFIATIFGVISYFRYYYWIEDDQLIIRSGVLSKSLTQIPFDRIQTIDFEQNLIHQTFNVVGLKIDTAGSNQAEIKMQALTKEKAEALREFILSQKLEIIQTEEGEAPSLAQLEEAEEIYSIDFGRLLKIGLTENHFRSGFVILFGLFWLFDNIREAGFDVDEMGTEYYNQALGSIFIIATLAVLFILISMFISIGRIFLKYFNLKFLRSYNGFKVIGGLFNRKEVAALDSKIQLLEWKQNLIQKYLGFHDLVLKQASSTEIGTKKSIVVPGVNTEDIENVKNYLFPERKESDTEMFQLNKWSLYRPLFYLTLIAIIFASIFIYIPTYPNLFFVLFFYILIVIRLFKKYNKAYYGVNDKALFVKGGVFGHKKWMTMLHKIQSLQISQSPFQVRRDLASLQIHTASGTKVIPFIELDKAEYLYDYLCYKVEASEEEWM